MHHALRVDDHVDPVVREVEQIMGLDYFQRFVGERRTIDGDLSAHLPGGVMQGVIDGRLRQALRRPVAKWATRGREDDSPNIGWSTARQALQDRRVLAVHGDDLAPSARSGGRREIARHDEGFLVRERYPLPRLERGERRVQPCGADHGVDYDVNVAPRGGFDEAFVAGAPGATFARAIVHASDEARRKALGLLAEQLTVRECRQRGDVKPVPLTVQHPERGRADRARRSEQRDATRHRTTGASIQPNSTYATGRTNRRLSRRSSNPPCPGMSRELSFTLASRLSNDSTRSPIWAPTLMIAPKTSAAGTLIVSPESGTSAKRT